MGLGHFLDSAGKALGNVAKGAEFVANHPGDVAKGVGKVGEYALEHPGQVASIAGHAAVKTLTDPKQLAITGALIGATVLTGGAAAPALAAEVGGEIAGEVGAEVGGEVIGSVATKTAAAAGSKAAAEAAAEAGGEVAGKTAAEVGGKTLGQRLLHPIESNVTGPLRDYAAQKVLSGAGEEGASVFRQGLAAGIQGVGHSAPTELEGMGEGALRAQNLAFKANRVNNRVNAFQSGAKGVEAVAHPVETAMKHASSSSGEALRSDAVRSPSGQTPVSQPGTEMQPYQQPGAMQPLSQPANNSYTPGRGFTPPPTPPGPPTAGGSASDDDWDRVLKPQSQQLATLQHQVATNNQRLFGGPSVASAYSGMAGSSNATTSSGVATAASRAGRRPMSATDHARAFLRAPRIQNTGGLRFWQGPHREMIGGVGPDYDWRKGYENRPQTQPRWGRFGQPAEAEQPAAYDVPSGQQPMGALNPGAPKMTALGTGDQRELGPGPRVHFGEPGARPMGPATDMGGRKASFYAGAQKNILDADSMSPDDYKFEPGGQGYLDFPDMPRQPLSQPSKRPKAILGV